MCFSQINQCYFLFVLILQPYHGNALITVPRFVHCLILGRKLIFFPSAPVIHWCFGRGAPDLSGCTVNSISSSGKKSGEEIYKSWLTSTVGSVFCCAHCLVDN